LFVAGGTVLVLVGAGIATWLWVLTHWFVGVAAATDGSDRVAVFRGFDTALLGLDLHRVDDVTDIPLDDLSSYDRNNVRDGIEASSASDARRIVDDLHQSTLPECEDTAGDERPSDGSATPSLSPSLTPLPPDGALPAPGSATASSTAGATASPTAAGSATESPEPGVGCREAE
jgi:protein phosphatase